MKIQKISSTILLLAVGIVSLPAQTKAQTPPSLNCPGVSVTWASSAAYAPLTSAGAGAPRICLPQCSTSVATCSTANQTVITPTFAGLGTGTITNRAWTVEGDIAIAGATNGTTCTIYSTLSNVAPFQYGKGRLKLTYTYTLGACACVGFVTLDAFKTANPLPTLAIIGPTCVSIGEDVAYSIAPDFSRNASVGIGIDNNYSWGSVTGFSSTSPTNYTSGDNSSQTYRVTSAPTGLQSVTVKPGHNTTIGFPTIPGTGCNNLQRTLGPIKRKAAGFNLTVTPGVISGYTIGGNTSNQVTACIDAGVLTTCTLSVPVASQEAGVTYTFSSSSTSVTIAPNSSDPLYSVIVTQGATGSAIISCLGTVLNGCGTASSTFTITRKVAPAPTSTFTRYSTNFGTPTAGVYCLRAGTYIFQLSGPVNLPAGLVTSGNSGLPTALGAWSWDGTNNRMTLTVTASGSSTPYNISLNGVTCANGNISVPDQYRLASAGNASFTMNNLLCGGNFDVTTSAFSNLSSCKFGFKYRWTVTPTSVLFANNNLNVYEGCGFNSAQLDVTTIPPTGCTISCLVSIPTIAPLCPFPGSCANCTTYTVTGTNPQTFVIPTNSETYLASCLVRPGDISKQNLNRDLNSFDFELNPNPTSDYLNVTLSTKSAENVRIAVCDAKGRILISELQNSNVFDVDCSSLESGVYFLRVQSDRDLKIKTFIKK